jgi:hypothetical protein
MVQRATATWAGAAGSRVARAYSPAVRTSTIVIAMKIRPSVIAAPATWWAAHHWASGAGNQFDAP